jgi:hypothetical protein
MKSCNLHLFLGFPLTDVSIHVEGFGKANLECIEPESLATTRIKRAIRQSFPC